MSPLASPVGAKVLSALRWSATTRLIGQAATWAMTIFVIRLLSPADYGVLAMAAILPAVLYLLNDLGLDVVLVQRQAGNDTIFRRQVFGVVIVINLLCALILVASAPLVAAFFREPILVPILRVLSLQFLPLVFEALPRTRPVAVNSRATTTAAPSTRTWLLHRGRVSSIVWRTSSLR